MQKNGLHRLAVPLSSRVLLRAILKNENADAHSNCGCTIVKNVFPVFK